MVLDGGGQFIPAGIVDIHKVSLMLASLVAYDRATDDDHTHHTGKERPPNTSEHTTWAQYIILDREVLNPSPCE